MQFQFHCFAAAVMSLDSIPSSALPPSSPAGPALGSGPLPPPPLPPQAERPSRSWDAAFKGAVKKLKRQVLALHYANQVRRAWRGQGSGGLLGCVAPALGLRLAAR